MGRCKNFVIMCMDYRFQSATHLWLKQRGFYGQYDVLSIAGSSLNLLNDTEHRTFILNQIDFALKNHGIERIIIFHHEDCAAMGHISGDIREQIKLHNEKMSQAEKVMINHFPNVKVEKYFISHKMVFYPIGSNIC